MSTDKTDEDWLMALAGKSRAGADKAVVQEALVVRRALERIRSSTGASTKPANDQAIATKDHPHIPMASGSFVHVQHQSMPISPDEFKQALAESSWSRAQTQAELVTRDASKQPPRPTNAPILSATFSRRRRATTPIKMPNSDFEIRERIEYERMLSVLDQKGLLRNPRPRSTRAWAIAASILVFVLVGANVPYEDDESWETRSIVQRLFLPETTPLTRGSETFQRETRKDTEKDFLALSAGLARAGLRFESKKTRNGDFRLRVELSMRALEYLQGEGIDTRNSARGWIHIDLIQNPDSAKKID